MIIVQEREDVLTGSVKAVFEEMFGKASYSTGRILGWQGSEIGLFDGSSIQVADGSVYQSKGYDLFVSLFDRMLAASRSDVWLKKGKTLGSTAVYFEYDGKRSWHDDYEIWRDGAIKFAIAYNRLSGFVLHTNEVDPDGSICLPHVHFVYERDSISPINEFLSWIYDNILKDSVKIKTKGRLMNEKELDHLSARLRLSPIDITSGALRLVERCLVALGYDERQMAAFITNEEKKGAGKNE